MQNSARNMVLSCRSISLRIQSTLNASVCNQKHYATSCFYIYHPNQHATEISIYRSCCSRAHSKQIGHSLYTTTLVSAVYTICNATAFIDDCRQEGKMVMQV